MRAQVRQQDAVLIVVYPRGYSENATDPGMLHARVLRGFGGSPAHSSLVFPGRLGDPRYGCPDPDYMDLDCSKRCCFSHPAVSVALARSEGRPVFLWWWRETAKEFRFLTLATFVQSLGSPTRAVVSLPPLVAADWECDRLEWRAADAERPRPGIGFEVNRSTRARPEAEISGTRTRRRRPRFRLPCNARAKGAGTAAGCAPANGRL